MKKITKYLLSLMIVFFVASCSNTESFLKRAERKGYTISIVDSEDVQKNCNNWYEFKYDLREEIKTYKMYKISKQGYFGYVIEFPSVDKLKESLYYEVNKKDEQGNYIKDDKGNYVKVIETKRYDTKVESYLIYDNLYLVDYKFDEVKQIFNPNFKPETK